MSRIRLRVEILKWNEGNTPKDVCPPRDETVLSWMEPCPSEMSISTLMDRISIRFEEIHIHKGKLRIKWIRDGYGDVLTGNLTVGDCFTDRSDRSKGPVDSKDWTVQVDRMKPEQHELQNPLRFASLAPESSARYQRRLVNPTLQQAVAGRRPLHYAQVGREASWLGRRPEGAAGGAQIDSDQPVRSTERDLPSVSQQIQFEVPRGNGPFIVADSQPSAEHQGASYGTPQSLSMPSPSDGPLVNPSSQIDISDVPVRKPGSYIEDDLSPKTEVSETEILIDQIPESTTEQAPNPINQTPIGSDGFRKPALPRKGGSGLIRSPNFSAEATLSRSAPLKRPNQSLGRRSHLDPVETDIESSQELPPLKRPKLAVPRRSVLAEPRSFNSINKEADDTTMRELATPEVAEEPLRDWPTRNAVDTEAQATPLNKVGARKPRQSRQESGKWQPSPRKSPQRSPSPRGRDGDLVRSVGNDLPDSRAGENARENPEKERDTFDIPSSPSPEPPTSSKIRKTSNFKQSGPSPANHSGPKGLSANQVEAEQNLNKLRGRRFSRSSPKPGTPGNHLAAGTTGNPTQKKQKTSEFPNEAKNPQSEEVTSPAALVSNRSNYETSANRTLGSLQGRQEPKSPAETSAKTPAQKAVTKRKVIEQKSSVAKEIEAERESRSDSTSAEGTAAEVARKPLLPHDGANSSAVQTSSLLDRITSAKKTNLEAPAHVSSTLRSSASQDRRSGTSVSFVDAQKEQHTTVPPTPTRLSTSISSFNASRDSKSNENHSINSEISGRIKGGFRGATEGSDPSAKAQSESQATKGVTKGKERLQHQRESASRKPEVVKKTVNEASEDEGDWERYTIDGNRGPSRHPRINALKSPLAQSGSGKQALPPAEDAAKRAPSVQSAKASSTEQSSSESSPRAPAKEVASSASGSSAEGSVNQDDSESGSEDEDSDSEGSEEAASVPEETQQAVLKSSASKASTANGPVITEHSTNVPSQTNELKLNGTTEKAHGEKVVITSGEESDDRADDDDEADLQLQSENRRSLELGSSQKRPGSAERMHRAKEPSSSALRSQNGQASQAKGPNVQTRTPHAKPLASEKLPRASNGRFVGVSALNAKSKTSTPNQHSSQRPNSNLAQPFQSSGASPAKAIQIDSLDDSDDSDTDDSEVEIKADSKYRQSGNRALEGFLSVQNLYSNEKKTSKPGLH